jgi:hypothetical protein
MYRDGMSCVGVLAPRAQLPLRGSAERWRRLEFHVVACMELLNHSPSSAPLFIEHTNGLYHHRPISPLIQIVMIASWTHHQQSPTWTRDNHIGKLLKVPNPLSV